MDNIYIFTESPLNITYSRKISLEYISQNFSTEVWTTFHRNNEYFKNSKNSFFNPIKINLIKNNYHLFQKLKKIKNKKNIFIYLDYNSSLSIFFLFILKIFNIKFIVPPRRTPFNYEKKQRDPFLYRIYKRDKTNLLNEIKKKIKYFFFTILNKFQIIQKPELFFVCGDKGIPYWKRFCSPKKIINTNSVDLLYKKKKKILNYVYCVYIDENKNFSPDLSFLKNSSTKTVSNLQSFYNNLNIFFNKIEKKYDCSVVISSSLKFDYKNENPFNNRSIIYDKTNELIQYSKFVISHHSSGYWQAIYDFKKIFFLTDENLIKFNQNNTVRDNSFLFQQNTIDTKDDLSSLNIEINTSIYKKILREYFLSDEFKQYKDIIKDEILKLFK